MAWRLLQNRVRAMDWLEAINGDCVRSRSNLQSKKLAGASEDLIGTSVELGQRSETGILTNT